VSTLLEDEDGEVRDDDDAAAVTLAAAAARRGPPQRTRSYLGRPGASAAAATAAAVARVSFTGGGGDELDADALPVLHIPTNGGPMRVLPSPAASRRATGEGLLSRQLRGVPEGASVGGPTGPPSSSSFSLRLSSSASNLLPQHDAGGALAASLSLAASQRATRTSVDLNRRLSAWVEQQGRP